MRIKRIDVILIVILIILTIITVDFAIFEEHRALIENIWGEENFSGVGFTDLGLRLLIVFGVCFVGNLLPVPTPYSWAVCLGMIYFFENPLLPFVFGFVASLGCLCGEIIGYLIGRGAAEIISEERIKNLNKFQEYLVEHPMLAPLLIFLFGATPLNDDFLTIPLGILKYDVKKTLIFCWLGKLVLMLVFAYNLFGICGLIGGDSWLLSIGSMYLIVIMVYAMVRINLVEVLGRILKKKEMK